MLTNKLTATAIANIGLAIMNTSRMVKRPRSIACSTGIVTSVKTPHQRSNQKVPTIDHHEQQQLERRRNHDWRQLQHSHRCRDRSHHHVDHQEGQKQYGTYLESHPQLREDVCRRDYPERQVIRIPGPRLLGQFDKESYVFFANVVQHELAHRSRPTFQRLRGRDMTFL